jgi:hypothetical protein
MSAATVKLPLKGPSGDVLLALINNVQIASIPVHAQLNFLPPPMLLLCYSLSPPGHERTDWQAGAPSSWPPGRLQQQQQQRQRQQQQRPCA